MAYTMLENNNLLIGQVKKISGTRGLRPRFIYAHLEMPHSPFFYDRDQRLRAPKELGAGDMIRGYLDYIPYTNARLKDLVTTIQRNTDDKAVIILMGDHGLRCEIPDPRRIHYFQNQNAVYFPDRDYRLLYDSISGVNQFRVIFNTLFREKIPLLEDSTILLQDPR
jgi:phosphoglycerol transferase MdoB-like AlkP superfamily enzyme